jgi:ABC-type nitrate/sulfonate/bicarbonate transport system permease component
LTAVAPPAAGPRPRRSLPGWAGGVIGIVGLVVAWELLTAVFASGSKVWPTPWHVLTTLHADGWSFYGPNLRTTVWEAARGFFWGNLIAIVLAILAVTLPLLEGPLTQLGVVSYCLPIVAVGSVFAIVFTGETSKVILAAIACFLTTFIGMVLGLRSAPASSLDLVRAYGGGRWQQLVRVRFRSSLPSLFAALRIAAPAAMLGAMIGEYLGAQSSGLGQAMVSSEQNFNVPRTWGIALVATLTGGVVYGLVAIIGRRVTPWAEVRRR